jgi:hypothetical protein
MTPPIRIPKFVTASYTMQKTDGWIVVAPALATGQVVIQLPFYPDMDADYLVTRAQGADEDNSLVDVVVVGNLGGGSAGDTLYSIPAGSSPSGANGYHIGRINETIRFAVSSQQSWATPRAYTDWFASGSMGLETFSSPFVPNLAGSVIVPLAGFAPGNGYGDGGHPRSFYGCSIAVSPPLTAGKLTLAPRFNGVALSTDVLDLTPATQPSASRVTALSPIAGPGVGFFTAQPGCFLFSPPEGGGILDLQVTGSGGAAGPTSGIVTASIF